MVFPMGDLGSIWHPKAWDGGGSGCGGTNWGYEEPPAMAGVAPPESSALAGVAPATVMQPMAPEMTAIPQMAPEMTAVPQMDQVLLVVL